MNGVIELFQGSKERVVAVPGVLRQAKLSNALSVQPHTNASDRREPFLTGGLLPGGHPLTQVVLTGPFLRFLTGVT